MLDTTASMVQYRGDGGGCVFPIPFPFLEAGHIHAHVRDGGGGTSGLAAGVDFAVNRVPGGRGELVLLARNLPAGHVLTIRRLLPLTQEILFHNQGPNSPRAAEEAADRLTMISQQLQAEIATCLRASDPEEAAALSEAAAAGAARTAALEAGLAGKAGKGHAHAIGDVGGLSASLAAKAEAVHRHGAGDVDGLTAAAVGALPAPPADGRAYLAVAGGWVEHIHPGSPDGGGGGTDDHARLANRDAADQHPQSAVTGLAADMGEIRSGLAALARADAELLGSLGGKADAAEIAALDARLRAADAESARLEERLGEMRAGLGTMAAAADAPADGRQYVRKNRAWAEAGAAPPGGGGGPGAGDIRHLPFRAGELPGGWHFCNGDRYPVESAPGRALAALPETFRADWGIAASGGTINLPSLFDASTGDGLFLRSVDGAARLPGSAQGDAIRNITGSFSLNAAAGSVMVRPAAASPSALSGAFTSQMSAPPKMHSTSTASYGSKSSGDLLFDASLAVPTAGENRPRNIGMTPAIYLGV